MPQYDAEFDRIECFIVLRVRGDHEGELTVEQLEEIDEQMEVKHLGENFAERIDVQTTEFEKTVTIEYVIKKSIAEWALHNKVERLGAFTELGDPFITVSARSFPVIG